MDNTTTYHICCKGTSSSPELHRLLQDLKHLEMQLGCHLEVTHVLGTTMIQQGMNRLSWGVWISLINYQPNNVTADLFHPMPPSLYALHWALEQTRSPVPLHQWGIQMDLSSWTCSTLIGTHMLWLLSPTCCGYCHPHAVVTVITRDRPSKVHCCGYGMG